LAGTAAADQHAWVATASQRQRIAAYGLVRDAGGRVLLARASPRLTLRGRWFLPGGGVQHGEAPIESVRREIAEESGLAVEVGPLLDVLSDVRTLPDGTSLHTVRLVYRIDEWSGTLTPEKNGTTDDVQWFGPDEVGNLPLAHYVTTVLERWL
jgi:ADP-ribose pyrophosphatase YjhB (NUDIX family)